MSYVVIRLAHSAAPDNEGSNAGESLRVTGRRRVSGPNDNRFFWATIGVCRALGIGLSCLAVLADVAPVVTAVPLDEAPLKSNLWLAVNLIYCVGEHTSAYLSGVA